MPKTIGVLGCGNMGSALLTGFSKALDKKEWRLACYDVDKGKMEALAPLGIDDATSPTRLASQSNIFIIALKPQQLPSSIGEIQLAPGQLAISVAAAVRLASLRQWLGSKCAIARCMPTLGAAVGHGVFAFCFDPMSQSETLHAEVFNLFGKIGACQDLEESRFPAFTALVGAGPAYIYEMMAGLCQAGVTLGFSQSQTQVMLRELLTGAAFLASEKKAAFMNLRDDVCSPGGITIAGVNVLDRAGVTGIFVDAVLAAHARGKEME